MVSRRCAHGQRTRFEAAHEISLLPAHVCPLARVQCLAIHGVLASGTLCREPGERRVDGCVDRLHVEVVSCPRKKATLRSRQQHPKPQVFDKYQAQLDTLQPCGPLRFGPSDAEANRPIRLQNG